jgi:hypothetical protein
MPPDRELSRFYPEEILVDPANVFCLVLSLQESKPL